MSANDWIKKETSRRFKLGLLFSLIFFIFVLSGVLYAEKVRYVIDGDTFILENNQRVRMIGINAPETSHPRYGKKGQPFGNQAREGLRKFIEGKEVTLKDGRELFDRFGRRLAYVYLPDGTFVNREMVREGYAETYRKFPFEYKNEFLELEQAAKQAKSGMWGDKASSWSSEFADYLAALFGFQK